MFHIVVDYCSLLCRKLIFITKIPIFKKLHQNECHPYFMMLPPLAFPHGLGFLVENFARVENTVIFN